MYAVSRGLKLVPLSHERDSAMALTIRSAKWRLIQVKLAKPIQDVRKQNWLGSVIEIAYSRFLRNAGRNEQ